MNIELETPCYTSSFIV